MLELVMRVLFFYQIKTNIVLHSGQNMNNNIAIKKLTVHFNQQQNINVNLIFALHCNRKLDCALT